jgi:hypothetical protein
MLAAEREVLAEHRDAAEAGRRLERRDHDAVERVALEGGLEPDGEGDGERDAAREAPWISAAEASSRCPRRARRRCAG